MHKVPVLLIDGQPLTENVAIQIWIARNFPGAKLLPSDQMQEIKAISLMAWCASEFHPHLSRTNSPAKYCDAPGSEESIRRIAAKLLHENFRIADQRLAGHDYFFDHFTAADAHFLWCFRRATQLELPCRSVHQLHGPFRTHASAPERAESAGLRDGHTQRIRQVAAASIRSPHRCRKAALGQRVGQQQQAWREVPSLATATLDIECPTLRQKAIHA